MSHRTPNRLHSEAIREPFSASLPATPLVRSRVGSPSAPHFALPRHPRSPSLVSLTAAPILSPFFSSFTHTCAHTHTYTYTHRHTRAQVVLSFPLEIFSLSVHSARRFFASHSVPSRPLLALLCQSSYTRRTHEHQLSLSPSSISVGSFSIPFFTLLRPVLSVPLSPTRLASRLVPPSCHSTLPPRSARDSTVLVSPPQPAVLPLRFRLLSRLSVPLLPLALGSNAGVYSRCHLIAGRFSRVRYRSATESTQSAGTRSCSDSSFSLSFFLSLSSLSLPHCFSPSFCPSVLIPSLSFSRSLCLLLHLPPHPRAAFLYSSTAALPPAGRRRRGLPLLASLPRDVNIVGLVVTRWKTRAEKKRKAKHRRVAATERPTALVHARPGCEDDLAPLLPPFTDLRRHVGIVRGERERETER